MKSILAPTVADDMLLLDYLREVARLIGIKQGCDGGKCGASIVLVYDQPRLACSTLAMQMQRQRVEAFVTVRKVA